MKIDYKIWKNQQDLDKITQENLVILIRIIIDRLENIENKIDNLETKIEDVGTKVEDLK